MVIFWLPGFIRAPRSDKADSNSPWNRCRLRSLFGKPGKVQFSDRVLFPLSPASSPYSLYFVYFSSLFPWNVPRIVFEICVSKNCVPKIHPIQEKHYKIPFAFERCAKWGVLLLNFIVKSAIILFLKSCDVCEFHHIFFVHFLLKYNFKFFSLR